MPEPEHPEQPLWRQMFDGSDAAQLLIDPSDGSIVDANAAAARFYGWSRDELRQMRISDINQLPDELVTRDMGQARSESRNRFEFRHRRASGELRHVEVCSSPVFDGQRTLLHSIVHDITERNDLARQLYEVQRMESLGLLAGGVAHDFNNLLTGILCSAGLALSKEEPDSAARPLIENIRDTCERATNVTRQLLAFSRKQVLRPQLVDLVEAIEEMRELLERVAGEPVRLETEAKRRPATVIADRTQIEQVLMNLVINARDAMPQGGTVRIAVDREQVGEEVRRHGIEPGPYAVVSVADEGVGMDEATQARIFEPFYTTKRRGGGTGLGLSTAFGIVRQSGGALLVASEVGRGSTFRVLLPYVARQTSHRPKVEEPVPAHSGGDETVLLVDDDDDVREAARAVLEAKGYHVLAAASGAAGIERARVHEGDIHVLVTDFLMPGMNGREVAEEVLRLRPGVTVLYVSGYVDQPLVEQGMLDASAAFLEKPFRSEDLLRKVRGLLDAH